MPASRGPRYVTSIIAALVGSATLPQGSLYASATVGPSVIEMGWFTNSGSTKKVNIQRLTSAGTPGAGQTEAKYDPDSAAASCTAFDTHTGAPGLGDALHRMPQLSSAQSGWQWGWHDEPVEVPVGTANGIGFLPTTAIGNADVTMVWEE